MRRLLPVIAAAGFAVAGCGDATPVTSTESASGQEQRYTATATVLESPEHGPQLCLGAVTASLPPQCGGPDIVNWSWDDVDGAESMAGTTWGSYTVIGTYDGERFTLTEPPAPPTDHAGVGSEQPTFPTPCEEPADGWTVVDEPTAPDEAMYAAIDYAAAQAEHAGTWVDQSINPALTEAGSDTVESAANDPTKLVLNFRFTADLDRHEQEIRAIWGGALCVSLAEHTEAALRTIQDELHAELPAVLSSGVDTVTGVVEIQVVLDNGDLQQQVDDRYGPGTVRISSALQPVS